MAGRAIVMFALTRYPFRVVTTSVDGYQLEGVLWGEIREAIRTACIPLDAERGGPFVVNHLHIRYAGDGEIGGLSYIIGRVAERGEGLSGHHLPKGPGNFPFSLAVVDEASGVNSVVFDKVSEWAHRLLVLGNPYECHNDFKWAVKGNPKTKVTGGDIRRENGVGYSRKIIRIRAEDTPNVRLGLAQKAAGLKPTYETLVPGVLPFDDYETYKREWDELKQTAGLGGDFYEGGEVMLFPKDWLAHSAALALKRTFTTKERYMGMDSAEGGDNSAWVIGDELGLLHVESLKTTDTTEIVDITIRLMREWGVHPENTVFDRGGGGRQHVDRLKKMKLNVKSVGFGESISPEPRKLSPSVKRKRSEREERYEFKNRRAEMYWMIRELINPTNGGYAIPARFAAIHDQLAPIPLRRNGDGGYLELPPKRKKDPSDKAKTLIDIIGHSPDEADAFACMAYAKSGKARRIRVGGFAR